MRAQDLCRRERRRQIKEDEVQLISEAAGSLDAPTHLADFGDVLPGKL